MTVHDRRSKDTLAAGRYAVMEVKGPYDTGEEKSSVIRQLKGDTLAYLHSHGHINDAQYYAGREYQKHWETAERGARAIDISKEAVDGGRLPEPLTDAQVFARKGLIRIRSELGTRLTATLDSILINGQKINVKAGSKDQVKRKLEGSLFRVALTEIAILYGFANGMQGEDVESGTAA